MGITQVTKKIRVRTGPRIKITSQLAPRIDPADVAKALGAEIVPHSERRGHIRPYRYTRPTQVKFMKEDKIYVLRYPDGNYVGVDIGSGGYPYKTDWPGSICYFVDREAALLYQGKFYMDNLTVWTFDFQATKADET